MLLFLFLLKYAGWDSENDKFKNFRYWFSKRYKIQFSIFYPNSTHLCTVWCTVLLYIFYCLVLYSYPKSLAGTTVTPVILPLLLAITNPYRFASHFLPEGVLSHIRIPTPMIDLAKKTLSWNPCHNSFSHFLPGFVNVHKYMPPTITTPMAKTKISASILF